MLWNRSRSSDNVVQAEGGGRGIGFGRIHLGVGGTILAIIIAIIFPQTRGIIFGLLTGGGDGYAPQTQQVTQADANDPQVQFVRHILGST
ncbi:MAG TPA: neutral zinc metallopeptidase, partial [Rhodanobacteraceae bacterium]|nr:neutral zinc metallopeptidase [Rhodanobacteraceae bacterium]